MTSKILSTIFLSIFIFSGILNILYLNIYRLLYCYIIKIILHFARNLHNICIIILI